MAASGKNPSGGSSTPNTGSIASSTAQFDRSRANRSGQEDSAKYLLSLPVSTHYLEKNALVCCRTDRFNNLCRNLGTNNCILSDGLLHKNQLVVTIRLACGDQFCKACFMDTYFTDDPPTCRARDRHAAEHRLPSAEVLGIGADEPQAQITATQGKSKLSSAKPSVSSRAYRIQVKPTGAAATTAMCEVLELVIGVWKGNGDETLDYGTMSPWIIYAHFNETGARNIAMIQHKLERKELFTDSAGNDRYFWNEEITTQPDSKKFGQVRIPAGWLYTRGDLLLFADTFNERHGVMAAGPGPFVNQLQHSQSDLGAFESQQRLEESRFGQVFIAESNSGNRITEADFGSDTDFTIPTSFVEESRKLESDSELMRNEAFEIKGELYHQNPKSQFFTGKGSTLRERIPASDYGRFLANIPISQAFHSTSINPGERMHPNNEPSPGKTEAPIEIQQTTTFAKTDSNTAMVKQQKPPPPTGPKPKSFQLVKNQQTLSVPAKSNEPIESTNKRDKYINKLKACLKNMPSLPTSIHSKTDLRSFLENWQKGLKNIEEEMTKGYIQLCFKTPNARTTLASPQTSSNDQEDILNKILASKSDNAILELALVLTKMRLLVSEGPMRLSYNSYDELLRLATYLIQQLTKVSEKQAGEEVCYSLEKIFKQAAQSLSDFIRKYFT